MKSLKYIIALLIIISAASVSAKADKEGTCGGVLLTVPVGPRSSAMADAFTAVDDDLNCIYSNPAGIATLKKSKTSFIYQRNIADDSFGVVDIGAPLNGGALGGSLIYYTAGNINLIDTGLNEKTVNAQRDYIATLTYGFKAFDNFYIGTNERLLHSTLVDEFSALVFVFDVGALYKRRDFNFGLALKNIGSKLKYDVKGDSLPFEVAAGAAYAYKNLLATADVKKTLDDSFKGSIGAEYNIKNVIALRSGYKINYDLDTFSGGIGLFINNFELDYALSSMNELGYAHRVSLGWNF